jgi:23S rRNA (guanosine2251-2'-O)-methyltransferase
VPAGNRRVVAGKRAVLEAIRAGNVEAVLVASGSRRSPAMRDVVDAAAADGVSVEEVDRRALDELARDHRGVVAHVRVPVAAMTERDLSTFEWANDALVVLLDGVEDPQNLGAAARSAEASGVAMLITRTRRAAPVTPAAVRASAGALSHLPHARVANLTRAIERLHDVGFTVAGLDEHAGESIYGRPCPEGRLALVVGSEGSGISRLVREHCDLLVSLPMRGKVGSLNAAASLAAVLYGWVIASPQRRNGA